MKKRAFVYIVVAGILWGSSGIFFNLLKPFGFSALQMTAMRGTVSAVAVSLYALIKNRPLFKVTKRELILFVCSGFAVFGTAAFYYAAIEASSVSTAVILMYTAPIFVMAYSVAFLGEKLNTLKILSGAAVLVGCALVSGIIGDMQFSFLGMVLGLSAGVSYSGYNILAKIEMMQGSKSLSATLYSFIVMGAVSLAVCNPAQMMAITSKNPIIILPLMVGIGICTCVLPYFLYNLALRDIPVGTASTLGIIEPMSATVFSVVFFGEELSASILCGILLILAAVFALNKNEM